MDDDPTNEATSSYSKTSINNSSHEWVELTDPADSSRLVIGCPVCFLTTVNANGHTSSTVSTIDSASGDPSTPSPPTPQPLKHNVMVISWLMPVAGGNNSNNNNNSNSNNNNSEDDGLILLSMNRRRHTASVLLAEITKTNTASFGLSIPTSSSSLTGKDDTTSSVSIEDLLANVGKTSGRWGRSKFPGDYTGSNYGDASLVATSSNLKNSTTIDIKNKTRPNKKSRQARKRDQFARGIPHLKRTMFGSDSSTADSSNREQNDKETPNDANDNNDFAIDGTIAHLQCQVVHLEEEPVIDDDHYFIVARITKAFVKSSHWDPDRRVFCYNASSAESSEDPRSRHHFLTFFGSRRFGYVSASEAPQQTDQKAYREFRIKDADEPPDSWHILTDGKQWSRLLYTNPLCLMSTDINAAGNGQSNPPRTVVVSRLTATNNTGSFMFSLKQSVARELKLLVDTEKVPDAAKTVFSLSVPVQGMEGFVQQILRGEPLIEEGSVFANNHVLSWESIPLAPRLGDNDTPQGEDNKSLELQLKCIVGCVAFMECHVYRTAMIPAPSITANRTDTLGTHVAVFAKVDRAFVHPSYWNDRQNWFLPTPTGGTVYPYIKYLDNATFGYILPTNTM